MQKIKYAPKVNSNEEFVKSYKSLGECLPPVHEKLVEFIYNRLELSNHLKNPKFYDEKEHKYYTVASRDTLAKELWCSPRKAGDLVNELRSMGYFYTKTQKDKPLKFFSYNFNIIPVKAKRATTQKHNLPPNNTTGELDLNSHDDTQHTSSEGKPSDLNLDDKIMGKINDFFDKVVPKKQNKEDSSNSNLNDNQDSKHLNYATEGTKSMPKVASKQIKKVASMIYGSNESEKANFIYNINGIVFATKSQVSKENDLYDFFRWENNQDLVNEFNKSIYEMIYATYVTKNPDNTDKYLFGSLYNFFNQIANRKLGKTDNNKNYTIPKKQSSNKQSSGRKHIKEKLPDWAKPGYEAPNDKISSDRKKELKAKLAKINKA